MSNKLKLSQEHNQIKQDYLIHKFIFKSTFYHIFILLINYVNFYRHFKFFKIKNKLFFTILLTLFHGKILIF